MIYAICKIRNAKGLNIMCSNCGNNNNNSGGNNNNNSCGCSDSKMCRIAVTVEDNFAPCTFPQRYFDVVIRSRDGGTTLTGRVAGGGSAIFSVPCDSCGCDDGKEYAVTVTGNEYSSPRAQTRRVRCCCGQTAGVTFIFMTFEPDCPPKFCPPCPPPCPPGPPCCCPPPPPHPHPPRPPHHHPQPHDPQENPIAQIAQLMQSEQPAQTARISQAPCPCDLISEINEIISGE